MATIPIKKETFDFLKQLSKNNNRDWFNEHKDKYLQGNDNMIKFADALLIEIKRHDNIETNSGKESLYRIYKDVRFSKDKTPYNCRFSGSFKRATKKLRGGYYFHIEPGNSFLAGGFWGPEPDDLKRIRQDIDYNYKDWKKMLSNKSLINAFDRIKGDQLGSAPRGYKKDNPAIDLLRYKSFILRQDFTDKEVLSPDFLKKVNDGFK